MARLSTHVLDTARGLPAEGVVIDLYLVDGDVREHLRCVTTNRDGRTDEPLLSGDRVPQGVYQLVFRAGDYFRGLGVSLPQPPFLDEIVIRFGVSDPSGNY